MSELTKTMRPVCVGRLIFEIPAVATLEDWRYEVDFIKINSIFPASQNQKTFDAKVNQLENKLKTSPHKTEGVQLKSKTQLSPERFLFVYRKDSKNSSGFGLESLFWYPNIEYQFKATSTNKYLEETNNIISALTKSFVAIPNMTPSNAPPASVWKMASSQI